MNRELSRLFSLMKMEADGGAGAGGTEDKDKGGAGSTGGNEGAKFTQEDLNRIGSSENKAGKAALLKAFGFEDEAAAKTFIELAKKNEEANKTQSQKDKDAAEAASKTASAEKARADLLEQKLDALKNGANPTTVDDLVVLVRNRVSETVDFKKALEEVKKTFPNFFTVGETQPGGTGTDQNPPRKIANKEDLKGMGQRLATKSAPATEAKKEFSYFSN